MLSEVTLESLLTLETQRGESIACRDGSQEPQT